MADASTELEDPRIRKNYFRRDIMCVRQDVKRKSNDESGIRTHALSDQIKLLSDLSLAP